MVLHNNKWDRRAKYQYLKKHGLLKKQQEGKEQEEEKGEETPEEIIDENEVENEQIDGEELPVAGELMLSFQDAQRDDTSEMDPEELAYYINLTKNSNKTYEMPKSKPVKLTDEEIGKMTFDQLAALDFREDDEDEKATVDNRGQSNVLSEEEKVKFEELNKKIEKDKLQRSIRERFIRAPSQSRKENSSSAVDLANLSELLGISVVENKPEKQHDLDQLLTAEVTNSSQQKQQPQQLQAQAQRANVPAKKTDNILSDEQLLDDLLGI